ncbi:tRNA (adenosine(37)-N6)-threonylcarbamoyltransferase complex dimerization subunit type 1 TsaB [Variovorax sp. PCZ-1]|uniref:tRNA (adenosine(37)-N6)-threonylcarbamoyltransferase complex dimerization subunit type 1 TsaB n=1 Tax=Variovorax sp. PCZ-1 TaxID=2835533 RepID=UPI001BCE73E4|nr:tRNA (adenosine(37)-N6)-threonylcarbamoyltransferase complex dimerization subunit type 1 TsaB [Variovorax sp. PCZ-1]MBS7806083.1 tRNA (adenosine(37)-N6)-threonylcarbamoyltransferase complex dimerization subunit type 1 TsaB [Variovorax sp. PCZ-1]
MKLLAFDCSTETLSIAVQNGGQVFSYDGAGGAQASSTMIPAIEKLMREAGLQYAQLDALVFGRGPGSFTGLRTACSVAQGLAFGAGIKVLPVDTLLVVAQEAQLLLEASGQAHSRIVAAQPKRIVAALDARMGEVYADYYEFNSTSRSIYAGELLKKPQNLLDKLDSVPTLIAGNIRPALDAQLSEAALALPFIQALPTARALLKLAPSLIAAGGLHDAEHALPLYIRDKVALTTLEREAQNTGREREAHNKP